MLYMYLHCNTIRLRSEDHAKSLMKTVCSIKIKKLAKYEKEWNNIKVSEPSMQFSTFFLSPFHFFSAYFSFSKHSILQNIYHWNCTIYSFKRTPYVISYSYWSGSAYLLYNMILKDALTIMQTAVMNQPFLLGQSALSVFFVLYNLYVIT